MNDEDREILIERQLRVNQIIALAIIFGAAIFMAMVVLMPQLGGRQPFGEPILTWISVAGGILMVLLGLFVPDMVGRRQFRQLRVAETLPTYQGRPVPLPPPGPAREAYIVGAAYQTRMIIRLALLEGATFFSLIAHMLERQWPSLVVAVALLGLMAANFPTRGRMDHWMEEMLNAE